jgi:uncharacterized cupredoxin-like copper-binding protein
MKKTFITLLVGTIAWIGATPPASASDSGQIQITMDDTFRVNPNRIMAKAGETVDFVVHNEGRLRHEFVIGDERELDEHAMEMRNMNGMSMPNMSSASSMRKNGEGVESVDVGPGETAHLVYHFTYPGELAFACLYPGHREAGMKGVINVK